MVHANKSNRHAAGAAAAAVHTLSEPPAPLATEPPISGHDSDNYSDEDPSEDQEDRVVGSFRCMVDDMALAAAEDDEDCEPIHENFERTAIASLFDFNEGLGCNCTPAPQ